jgi:hypothetical protein
MSLRQRDADHVASIEAIADPSTVASSASGRA